VHVAKEEGNEKVGEEKIEDYAISAILKEFFQIYQEYFHMSFGRIPKKQSFLRTIEKRRTNRATRNAIIESTF
jgi:hypothetical protein